MREFRRRHHQIVATILEALDADFLLHAGCYFAGGTRLALMLNEYRESRDVAFLCSNRPGFREIRETVRNDSLGSVQRRPLDLAREVRADRDGVRTVIDAEGVRIKIEILLEARLDLAGDLDPILDVPVLSLECAIAEKLLANADRGLDRSTLSRDLVDLAFLISSVNAHTFRDGFELAAAAYGSAVSQQLVQVLDAFQRDRVWAGRCIAGLGIDDTKTLRQGLRRLLKLVPGAA